MGKSGSVHTTSNGILPPCQNLEKINHTLSKKTPRQMEGWKDTQKDGRKEGRIGKPYFIRPFWKRSLI